MKNRAEKSEQSIARRDVRHAHPRIDQKQSRACVLILASSSFFSEAPLGLPPGASSAGGEGGNETAEPSDTPSWKSCRRPRRSLYGSRVFAGRVASQTKTRE